MARPLLGALFCASASHRLARKAGRGPGRPSWAVPPRSDAAEAPAPAPEDPRDQQDDDGADDRAQDARRVQREERHGVEEHQVLQEAPDEGADDPEAQGREQAHLVPAGYDQPGDGPRDQAHDEQDDNERQHVRNDTPVPGMLPRSATGRAGPGNGAGLASLTPMRYGAVANPVV